ncbi:MAG: FAD-containing monooxygenase EthA, partial [Alcanivorax sp.]|nr:FAD-containing monooxygenase EthA [Alcanivorax sp.]
LLNAMSRKGLPQVTPKDHDGSDTDKTFLDLQSGYVQRAAHRLPRQGDKAPWKVLSNYLYDLPRLRYGRLNDDALEFVKAEGGKRRRLGVSRG